jgi:hypothetical protein
VQCADDHNSGVERATQIPLGPTYTTGESGRHLDRLSINTLQHVLAYGKHKGFRSMIALFDQFSGPSGSLLLGIFLKRHDAPRKFLLPEKAARQIRHSEWDE